MMCTPCMSNYCLYIFLEIIDKKLEKSDKSDDDDVYIVHVKKYVIKIYSGLRR
jgi:hypothetical protein